MDIGAKLLVALVGEGDIMLYRKLALSERFFYGDEVPLFNFINKHVGKYSVLPKRKTVDQHFNDLPEPTEPLRFYADKVEQRYAHKRLHRALSECNEHMQDQDTFTAQNTLIEALSDLRTTQARTSLAEFSRDAHDMYMASYLKQQIETVPEIKMGWPSLDKFGGLRPGDILSIIGRPAMGKTFLILAAALYSMLTGQRALCISMEMPLMEIMERLVALYTKFPMDHIQTYGLSTAQQNKLPGALLKSKDEKGKLWVLDGNFASTVQDVFTLVYQLNPEVLFIDGAYLLQHPNDRLNKFQRIDANAELLKKRCSELGIPGVLSYQFNREAAKKSKKSGGKEQGDLDDIYGSDTIGQVSSVVLGLFEEESVETLVARHISVLKGRKGQIGKFRINWDFMKMDFTEIVDDAKKKQGILEFV